MMCKTNRQDRLHQWCEILSVWSMDDVLHLYISTTRADSLTGPYGYGTECGTARVPRATTHAACAYKVRVARATTHAACAYKILLLTYESADEHDSDAEIQEDVVLQPISESDEEKTRKPKRSKKDDHKSKSKPKVRNPSLTLPTGIR